MDWEEYVSEIAYDVMKEQSPKSTYPLHNAKLGLVLNVLRVMWVLHHYFDMGQQKGIYSLTRLLYELLKKLDAELKHEVCHWAAYYVGILFILDENTYYEHRMRLGQKAIFHLEAFMTKFMSIYKGFLIAAFG
ncbi:unnamed protein product [Prunus brigantina]